VGDQPRQLHHQLIRALDHGQVPSQAGGLGDDSRVLGVGLALAGKGPAHPVDHPARHVDHLLPAADQYGQQQRCCWGGQVHRPSDGSAGLRRPADQLLCELLAWIQLLASQDKPAAGNPNASGSGCSRPPDAWSTVDDAFAYGWPLAGPSPTRSPRR
jgi:hypothetical protein